MHVAYVIARCVRDDMQFTLLELKLAHSSHVYLFANAYAQHGVRKALSLILYIVSLAHYRWSS